MSTVPPGTPQLSETAQLARERLHEEIERVRNGVEEMLDEQESTGNGQSQAPVPVPDPNFGAPNEELRRELDQLRLETRTYVKRKVRKSEKKLERSVRELEARSDELEQRIDQVEADREEAEWRIHNSTEALLDGLLDDVRSIADRLAEPPSPAPPKLAPPPAPRVAQSVGRIGRPAPKR
jgi:DNA repair exonuclease SbcCD ATPase subunit